MAVNRSILEQVATSDLKSSQTNHTSSQTFDPTNFTQTHHDVCIFHSTEKMVAYRFVLQSSTKNLSVAPKVYDSGLRIKRLTPEIPTSFKLDNIHSLISTQPRLALEQLERFAKFDRQILHSLRVLYGTSQTGGPITSNSTSPSVSCKLIAPRLLAFPASMPHLTEIIFDDPKTQCSPREAFVRSSSHLLQCSKRRQSRFIAFHRPKDSPRRRIHR